MTEDKILEYAKQLLSQAHDVHAVPGVYAAACEFLRTYAGPSTQFLATLQRFPPDGRMAGAHGFQGEYLAQVLKAFIGYVEAGMAGGVSLERRGQLDTVSDLLEMAQSLLDSSDVHPAAAAVLIGATLEEFLRGWIEVDGVELGSRRRGLDTYSHVLREAEKITKQDVKDITSWAGIRNAAAHGEWAAVEDRGRIRLMLEGVNLFLRRYAPAA
jgi:hypothetical protein